MTVNSFATRLSVSVCVAAMKQIARLFRLIYLWENFFYFTFALMANFALCAARTRYSSFRTES